MILNGIAALASMLWLYLLTARGGFWRFRELDHGAPAPHVFPRVAVVVPARQEAAVIARSIASLVRQEYEGDFRVYIVDDHSSDCTVENAVLGAAGFPERLRVIPARALPPGWSGKVWALSEGIAAAEAELAPDYILLTDADIVHPPENLSALVSRAVAGGYDLVSLMARLSCRTLAEKALIPAFVFFFFKLYPPAWINDPRQSTAGAAGGCILVRASRLASIGGMPSIRGEIIDDCALAARVKRSGGRTWLGLSRATESIRDYAGFGEIESMIARSAFAQLNHSVVLLAATLVAMPLLYLSPLLLLTGRPLAALPWAMMSIAYLPAVRFYGRGWLWALSLPLAAAFYTGATLHSAVQYWRGKGGMWKGRAQDS
jgi:hopene-associated glycosyltransferase HpnB